MAVGVAPVSAQGHRATGPQSTSAAKGKEFLALVLSQGLEKAKSTWRTPAERSHYSCPEKPSII